MGNSRGFGYLSNLRDINFGITVTNKMILSLIQLIFSSLWTYKTLYHSIKAAISHDVLKQNQQTHFRSSEKKK